MLDIKLVGRVIDQPHPLPLALSAQNTNSFLGQFQFALVRVSMLTWSADFSLRNCVYICTDEFGAFLMQQLCGRVQCRAIHASTLLHDSLAAHIKRTYTYG